MTNDKGAEHEKTIDDKFYHRAAQIWCEDEHAKKELDAFLAMSIAKALAEAHAAGRREATAEVLPVLEFYGDKRNWLGKRFDSYHYNVILPCDCEDHTGGRRARALLKKLTADSGEIGD